MTTPTAPPPLPPSFHAQIDQDLDLQEIGTPVAALDRPPRPGEILYRELDQPRQVEMPRPFCLEGPMRPQWRPIFRGGNSVAVPAPVAARCGGLGVIGQGILLWGPRARLHCPSHFTSTSRENKHFLDEFKLHLGPFFTYDDEFQPRMELSQLREVHLTTPTLVLAQPGSRVFGHWLIEVLPRLLLAQCLGLEFDRVLLPSPFPIELTPLLKSHGLSPDRIAWLESGREIARLDDGIVCANLHFETAFAPMARPVMRDLRAVLAPVPWRRPWRRIFISRRNWSLQNRRLRNREAITERLRIAGFQEIILEALPLAEQARLLSEASHVIAEDGSACHMMIYAEPGSRLLVLQPSSRRNLPHLSLAEVLEQSVGFVVGATAEPAEMKEGVDYSIAPADLERGLMALLAG